MAIIWVCLGVFTFLITAVIKNNYCPPINNYISETDSVGTSDLTDTDSIQDTEEVV